MLLRVARECVDPLVCSKGAFAKYIRGIPAKNTPLKCPKYFLRGVFLSNILGTKGDPLQIRPEAGNFWGFYIQNTAENGVLEG